MVSFIDHFDVGCRKNCFHAYLSVDTSNSVVITNLSTGSKCFRIENFYFKNISNSIFFTISDSHISDEPPTMVRSRDLFGANHRSDETGRNANLIGQFRADGEIRQISSLEMWKMTKKLTEDINFICNYKNR